MTHLDEDRIERLRHGELAPGDDAAARAHLDACPMCRASYDAAERDENEVHGLLRGLDHVIPELPADVLFARHHARRVGRLRRAAAVVLLLGTAGAAAALPGSPVRSWAASALGRAEAPAPQQAVGPGVRIPLPADVRIVFALGDADVSVRVIVSGGDAIEVLTLAGAARFDTPDPAELRVTAVEAAAFEIHIPDAARRVEILHGTRTILRKTGADIVAEGELDDAGIRTLILPAGR